MLAASEWDGGNLRSMADSESSFLDDDDGGGFEFDPEKAFLMEEEDTEASAMFLPEGQEQQAPNSLHYDGSRESSTGSGTGSVSGSVSGIGTYTVSGSGTYTGTGTGSGIAAGNVFTTTTTTTTSTIANSDNLRFPTMSGSAGFAFPTFGESLPPLARVAMKRKQPDHLTMGDIVMVQPQKGRLANQPTRRFSGTEESSGGGGGSDMEECSNSAPHTPKDQGIPYRIPGSGGSDSSVYSHSSYSSSVGAYASSDTGGTSVYGAYSLFSEAPSFISINGDPGVGQYGSFTDKDEGSHSTLSQHDSPAFAFYPAAQKREALDVRRSIFDPETDTEMQLFCNFDFLEASSSPIIDITEMEAADLGNGDNLRAICDDILSTSPPHHYDDEDDNVIICEGGVPELHTGISLIMEQLAFQSYQHYQQQDSDQTRDITENVMTPKFTSSSSSGGAGGVPLSRKMSSCGIPSPLSKTKFSSAPSAGINMTNTRNITPFPSLIGEYAPWMSSDANDLVRGVAEPLHQSKFVIRPLSASLESIHNPETPETLAYFPESMRPFQSYSGVDEAFLETDNVPQLDQTTKEEIKNVLERANQERADKKRERSENLAAGGKSRHSFAIKYAQWAASQSLIESTWIRALLVGESIEFEEVSPVGWTIERGIQFCNAVISSIIHDSHFEESLEEFLHQFFLPKVLNPAIKKEDFEAKMIAFSSSSSSSPTASCAANSTKYTKTRIEISAQVSRLATEMISNLISPSIFSFFIEFCEPCLTFEDADSLYQALHDTMLVLSIPKSSKKPKSPSIQRPTAPKVDDPLYATDQALYSLALAAYVEKLEDYDRELKEISRQRRYREEKIRVRRIHKNRSFYFLKALVTHLPQPINCVDSRWSRGYLLSIPPSTVDEGDGEDEDEEKKTSSEKKKHDRHRKRKSHRNKHGKNDEEKQQLQNPPPLATKHENQDFFDALFFAKILRALLVLDDSVFFVQVKLEAFLASFHTEIIDSPLSIRYLRVIDRFMAISRFNVVANVLPRIIDYRRFVLYYLINTGAEHMGVLPVKVFSRSIVLGLASLFEALQLYQLYPTPSHKERTDRLLTLLRTPDLLFHIPIIFVLYNPIDFADIVPIIETALREKTIPTLRLHAYAEIFAMTKNIDLLPLLQRKVLKFTPPVQSASSCGSERDSQAIYDWNMPRRLKNLFEFEKYRSSSGSPIPHHHLQLPSKSDNMGCKLNVSYWNFAARILLARQFGISFDAANFKDQAHENFTWLECIAVVNFFLDREAQTILAGALRPVNPDLYKVFRVIDSQENLHRSTQLPRDEPTHYVNLFINSAFTSLTPEEKAAILKSFNGLDGLFDSIFKATQNTPIKQLLELNPQGKVLLIHRIRNDSQFKWKPTGFSPFIFK